MTLQRFEDAMGTLSEVSCVKDFQVYCKAMAACLQRCFGGSDDLLKYVVSHCVRKLWLRVEGLCDKGAWRTAVAGRSCTPASGPAPTPRCGGGQHDMPRRR